MSKRAPKSAYVGEKKYRLVVLKITGRDKLGRPSEATIGYDDTVFNLEGGEEFMTCFIPAEMMGAKN